MIRQCAWCRSFIVKGLRVSRPLPVISGYSHGICLKCRNEISGKKVEMNSKGNFFNPVFAMV